MKQYEHSVTLLKGPPNIRSFRIYSQIRKTLFENNIDCTTEVIGNSDTWHWKFYFETKEDAVEAKMKYARQL